MSLEWASILGDRWGHRYAQREDRMKTQRKYGIIKPWREASEETNQLKPSFQTSGLQNCEKTYFCCFSHSVLVMADQSNYALPTSLQPTCSNWTPVPFLTCPYTLSLTVLSWFMVSVFCLCCDDPLHRFPFTVCLCLDSAQIPHPLKHLVEHHRWMTSLCPILVLFTSSLFSPSPVLFYFVEGWLAKCLSKIVFLSQKGVSWYWSVEC